MSIALGDYSSPRQTVRRILSEYRDLLSQRLEKEREVLRDPSFTKMVLTGTTPGQPIAKVLTARGHLLDRSKHHSDGHVLQMARDRSRHPGGGGNYAARRRIAHGPGSADCGLE